MNRSVIASVPVRSTFWSGLDRACVTHWRIDDTPVTTLSLRTRMQREGTSWLPGHPSLHALDLRKGAPTVDEGFPIKNNADVFLRGDYRSKNRKLTLRIGTATLPDALAMGGPSPDRASLRDGRSVSLESDLSTFQLSPSHLQIPPFGPGAVIGWDIDGIAGVSGIVDFALAVRADLDDGSSIVLDMICDSVTLDLERHEVDLVWRGMFIDKAWGNSTERFVVGIVPADTTKPESDELLDAGLARAQFYSAAHGDDVYAQTTPPDLNAEELTLARLSAWDHGPGTAALDAEEFAVIAAELDEGPRKDVLKRHGFDEISWGVEEWAHAERIANEQANIPDDIADETAESNAAKLQALPPLPPGQTMSITEYARLAAHLEVRDPGRVLEEARFTVRQLVRLEMTMTEAMEQNPSLADEFSRSLPTFHEEVARAHAADLERIGMAMNDEGDDEGDSDE